MNIPNTIFKNKLDKISWKKIYEREYGVQYSEVAVSLLAGRVKDHFPKTSVEQVVIPGIGNNTAFYVDSVSWIELVEGLNNKYTSHVDKLELYEKKFIHDGSAYLETAKNIHTLDLKNLTNKELKQLYQNYQNKLYLYSTFAWSAFILNNYVAERAISILDAYINRVKKENDKQNIHDSLFHSEKRAAALQLQYEVEKNNGKLTKQRFLDLYERFKWLSCLDIHNKPWTKEEFREYIKPFIKSQLKRDIKFEKIAEELKIKKRDLEYLLMAKRFVYIKDARDDYRRQGVYYALPLFQELAARMRLDSGDISFLQELEILAFLDGKIKISKELVDNRKKGFAVYLDSRKNLVCVHGDGIQKMLKMFRLLGDEEKIKDISGRVASKGTASGKVVIVKGVKDLAKVREGDILVAVTTHPDYVSAMRKVAAIVTDEGGITSHAAIVSREFGIPCIVGTKSATHLLNDGDRVEVDAIEGRVKILK